MSSNYLNIPGVTVTDSVKILADIYLSAIRAKMPFRSIPTPFLWGPPGAGKSQGVRELAAQLEQGTGKKVFLTDVRLLLFNPVDLRGIPTASADKTEAVWLKPAVFQMDSSESVINILFLDELSAAPPSVQAAAYQITLDRKIGEHMLPENCIVICAGNRSTDRSVAYKLPAALANRLMHFNILTSFESWKDWAEEKGIDERIIGFLSFKPDRLSAEDLSSLAFPSPRSWEFVSSLLKLSAAENLSALRPRIASLIGTETAGEFLEWVKIHNKLPSMEDILSGKEKTPPKKQDLLYSLSESLFRTLADRRRDFCLTQKQFENACEYAMRFPVDYAVSFFKYVAGDADLLVMLNKNYRISEWVKTHANYL